MNPRNATPSQPTAYTIACRTPSGSAVPHCPLRRGTTRPERHIFMFFRWNCVRWGFRGSTCRPARATQAPAPAYTIASIQQLTQLCAIIKCFALCVPLCSPCFVPRNKCSSFLRAHYVAPSKAFFCFSHADNGQAEKLRCTFYSLLTRYRSDSSSAGSQCALGRAYPF